MRAAIRWTFRANGSDEVVMPPACAVPAIYEALVRRSWILVFSRQSGLVLRALGSAGRDWTALMAAVARRFGLRQSSC